VQALAASNGVYRIRVAKGSDRDTHSNYVYSFVKAVSNSVQFNSSCSMLTPSD